MNTKSKLPADLESSIANLDRQNFSATTAITSDELIQSLLTTQTNVTGPDSPILANTSTISATNSEIFLPMLERYNDIGQSASNLNTLLPLLEFQLSLVSGPPGAANITEEVVAATVTIVNNAFSTTGANTIVVEEALGPQGEVDRERAANFYQDLIQQTQTSIDAIRQERANIVSALNQNSGLGMLQLFLDARDTVVSSTNFESTLEGYLTSTQSDYARELNIINQLEPSEVAIATDLLSERFDPRLQNLDEFGQDFSTLATGLISLVGDLEQIDSLINDFLIGNGPDGPNPNAFAEFGGGLDLIRSTIDQVNQRELELDIQFNPLITPFNSLDDETLLRTIDQHIRLNFDFSQFDEDNLGNLIVSSDPNFGFLVPTLFDPLNGDGLGSDFDRIFGEINFESGVNGENILGTLSDADAELEASIRAGFEELQRIGDELLEATFQDEASQNAEIGTRLAQDFISNQIALRNLELARIQFREGFSDLAEGLESGDDVQAVAGLVNTLIGLDNLNSEVNTILGDTPQLGAALNDLASLVQSFNSDNTLAIIQNSISFLANADDLIGDNAFGALGRINGLMIPGTDVTVQATLALVASGTALAAAIDSGDDAARLINGANFLEQLDDIIGDGTLGIFGQLNDIQIPGLGNINVGQLASVIRLADAVDSGDTGDIIIAGAQTAQLLFGNVPILGYAEAIAALAEGDIQGAAVSAFTTYLISTTNPYAIAAAVVLQVFGFGQDTPPDPRADLTFERDVSGNIVFSTDSNETGEGLEQVLQQTAAPLIDYLNRLEDLYGDALPSGQIDISALPELVAFSDLGSTDVGFSFGGRGPGLGNFNNGGRGFENTSLIIGENPSIEEIARILNDVVLFTHVNEDWFAGERTAIDPITGEEFVVERYYSPFARFIGDTVTEAVPMGFTLQGDQLGGFNGLVVSDDLFAMIEEMTNLPNIVEPNFIPSVNIQLSTIDSDEDYQLSVQGLLNRINAAAGGDYFVGDIRLLGFSNANNGDVSLESINGDEIFSFVLDEGFDTIRTGENASFEYTVIDEDGNIATATASLRVNIPQEELQALGDTFDESDIVTPSVIYQDIVASVDEGNPLETTTRIILGQLERMGIVGSDYFIDGVDLQGVTASGTSSRLTVQDDGDDDLIIFSPSGSQDFFEYTLVDGGGNIVTGRVVVRVDFEARDVRAEDDLLSLSIGEEDESGVVFREADLLANDRTGVNDNARIIAISLIDESEGELIEREDGSYLFVPASDFVGGARLEYTIHDGDFSSTAQVQIDIEPNVIPGPNLQFFAETSEDFYTPNLLDQILAAAGPDYFEGEISILSLDNAQNGVLSVEEDDGEIQEIIFFPAGFSSSVLTGEFAGYDYSVVDEAGNIANGTVSIYVDLSSDDRERLGDTFDENDIVRPSTIEKDLVLSVTVGNNLEVSASEIESAINDFYSSTNRDLFFEGEIALQSVSNAIGGSLSTSGESIIFDTSGLGEDSPGAFEYTVLDSEGHAVTGRILVNVQEENFDVTAVDDDLAPTIDEDNDVGFLFNESELLSNDIDQNGDAEITQISLVDESQGTLNILDNGSYTFVPAHNFNGIATLEYTLSDGVHDDTAQAFITVNPVEDPPYIRAIEPVVGNERAENRITDLLDPDIAGDVDGDEIRLEVVDTTGGINASVDGDTIVYRDDTAGQGTISYRVVDEHGNASDTVSVDVTTNDVNRPPTNIGLSNVSEQFARNHVTRFHIRADDQDGVFIFNANISATDADGDRLTYTASATSTGNNISNPFNIEVDNSNGSSNANISFVVSGDTVPTASSRQSGIFGFLGVEQETRSLTEYTPLGINQFVNLTVNVSDGQSVTRSSFRIEVSEPTTVTRIGLPVVLDLNGDGLNLASADESNAFFDWNGDGVANQTGWIVGQGDGILVFDHDQDGKVTQANEISFIDYLEGANTDLEGLRAFDSNGDGLFSANDERWSDFALWVDDGDAQSEEGEFKSLEELGVTSINLQSDENFEIVNGNSVFGETEVIFDDGATSIAGDVGFEFLENEQVEQSVESISTVASAVDDDLLSDEELDRMIMQANSDAATLADETSVVDADSNPDAVVSFSVDDEEQNLAAVA